jgi:hypothetical protein
MALINVIGYVFFVIFLSAVIIALSIQFQIRIGRPAFQNHGVSILESRHRLSGWIAISGLAGVAAISIFQRDGSPILIKPFIFLHVPLLTICAAVKLRKGWVIQSKRWRIVGKPFAWWIINLIIGMSFCIVTCAMVIWQYFDNGILMISSIKALPYQSLLFGHIGLAFALIWLGRTAFGRDRVPSLNAQSTD